MCSFPKNLFSLFWGFSAFEFFPPDFQDLSFFFPEEILPLNQISCKLPLDFPADA